MINGHGDDGDGDCDGDAVYSFFSSISHIVSACLNVHHCKTIFCHQMVSVMRVMVVIVMMVIGVLYVVSSL